MQLHKFNWFVTLTYNDAHLPEDGSVRPRELQEFMKRLRYYANEKVRFYGVGEYGDISGRPHYHVVLFGLTDPSNVARAWTFGMVHVGTLTEESAGYTCGYVTKGATKSGDPRLKGRHPEFARMSRNKGIGEGAAEEIARVVNTKGGVEYVLREQSLPNVVRAGGTKWPLGRYMLRKVALASGYAGEEISRFGLRREVSYLPADNHLKLRQWEFRTVPGARDLHEQKRVQAARKAAARERITRSKKGIGL